MIQIRTISGLKCCDKSVPNCLLWVLNNNIEFSMLQYWLTSYRIKKDVRSYIQISVLFIFFLSSFSNKHNLKTIRCMWIIFIPNKCSAIWHFPFLVCSSVWATTGELRPQNCPQRRLTCLVHTRTTERVQPWVSRRSTIVLFTYLALKTNSVQPKTLLCI